MNKLEFASSNFAGCNNPIEICSRAQELFDDWYKENIEAAPIVFGSHIPGTNDKWSWGSNQRTEMGKGIRSDTHAGRIICITELPKKECEHKPIMHIQLGLICDLCDRSLKPKGGWEVV